MKKIVLSLSMIAVVAIIAVGATGAFFSDTETSTGNTFAAGAIDLTIDSTQHYNGNVCTLVSGDTEENSSIRYEWVGVSTYPVPGTACDGTWAATDLGAEQKFFNFSDVKPGDSGENTVSLHVDNNDAWLRLVIKDVTDLDNSCNQPEGVAEDDPTCGGETTPGAGELRENLLFFAWLDWGATQGFQCVSAAECSEDPTEGDNVKQETEPTIITEGSIDESNSDDGISEIWNFKDLGDAFLPSGSTAYFGVAWRLPGEVGNEVQTDSMSATMEFQVEQKRNNSNPFNS